jgi:crotonobetaine/carnitine-CoA ligase
VELPPPDARDTITAVLARAATRFGDRTFLRFGDDTYTYSEVASLTDARARALAGQGVRAGTTLLSMLDNSIDAVTTWFAVHKLGAVFVPLNTALKREFLLRPITDSQAQTIIIDAEYLPRLVELGLDATGLKTVIVRGQAKTSASTGVKLIDLGELGSPEGGALPDRNRPEDLAALIYTSGTTGAAKGCMLSQNYLCSIGRMGARSLGYRGDDVIWTALPLFHINAMGTVLGAMLVGASVAIERRFSLSGFWPAIERSRASIASVLGSMIPLIASAPDTPESLRCRGQLRVVSGAPFPATLRQTWEQRFGVEWAGAPGFGTTEAALITCIDPGEIGPDGSSGRRNEVFDARLVDDEGRELPPDQPGELILRGRFPNVMFDGYWRLPEVTARAFQHGWYHSGDIGKFDAQGYFYFLGRKKEYLRHRGENVSTFELENIFREHPDIADVAVHGVPSPLSEDDIKVVAVRREGSQLTEEELYRWALERLPSFATPNYIEFRYDLPRNPLGKVMKYALEAEPITERTWRAPTKRARTELRDTIGT